MRVSAYAVVLPVYLAPWGIEQDLVEGMNYLGNVCRPSSGRHFVVKFDEGR
jgi:hypothetical protein